jgi:hypothetical protein
MLLVVRRSASMPGTAVGLFIIDFIVRPFARVFEKWPDTIMLVLLLVYGIIGYIVWKSAFKADPNARSSY